MIIEYNWWFFFGKLLWVFNKCLFCFFYSLLLGIFIVVVICKIFKFFLVFLSDFGLECVFVKEVVDEWNDIYVNVFGYQIEFVGWEDILFGFGRL